MIGLILTLVIIGVILYFLEQLPLDPTIRMVIRVVIILCVVIWLLQFLGVADMPLPHWRR